MVVHLNVKGESHMYAEAAQWGEGGKELIYAVIASFSVNIVPVWLAGTKVLLSGQFVRRKPSDVHQRLYLHEIQVQCYLTGMKTCKKYFCHWSLNKTYEFKLPMWEHISSFGSDQLAVFSRRVIVQTIAPCSWPPSSYVYAQRTMALDWQAKQSELNYDYTRK